MRKILSICIIFYAVTSLASAQSNPDYVCGSKAQNVVIEVNKDYREAKVFMTSGGYTDYFELYQTRNPKIFCEDNNEDTKLCFHYKKSKDQKSDFYFLRAGVKIEIARVKCRRNF